MTLTAKYTVSIDTPNKTPAKKRYKLSILASKMSGPCGKVAPKIRLIRLAGAITTTRTINKILRIRV